MRSKKTINIIGKTFSLSGDRSVFFGRYPKGKDETYAIVFTNKDKSTKIRLTKEALDALVVLYYDAKGVN